MWKSKLDAAINILSKYRGKIFSQDQLYHLLSDWEQESEQKKYKLVYYLKLRGYLVVLRRNLFLIKDSDQEFSQDSSLLLHYRKILNEDMRSAFGNKRYIWGLKALEIHMMDYDIIDDILIVNPSKQASEVVLFDKMMQMKTYSNNKKNLISSFCKYTERVVIGREKLLVARWELALLETLYNSPILQKAYAEEMIKKWVRKHKKTFDLWVIEGVLRLWKHNSSVNRLAGLVRSIDPALSEKLMELVRKFGHVLYE